MRGQDRNGQDVFSLWVQRDAVFLRYQRRIDNRMLALDLVPCTAQISRYNRPMNRFLTVLLLCPLAAVAAEWRYDGEASVVSMSQKEQAMPAKGTVAMTEMSMEAPSNAPSSGITMSKVRETVGEPESVVAPVGEPPITRWQYPGYVVYFENDRVIISVAGRL